MKLSSKARAGDQRWHRIRRMNPGIRTTGIDDPSWIKRETVPVESLQRKQAMKEQVRESLQDIDPEMITVCKPSRKGMK